MVDSCKMPLPLFVHASSPSLRESSRQLLFASCLLDRLGITLLLFLLLLIVLVLMWTNIFQLDIIQHR